MKINSFLKILLVTGVQLFTQSWAIDREENRGFIRTCREIRPDLLLNQGDIQPQILYEAIMNNRPNNLTPDQKERFSPGHESVKVLDTMIRLSRSGVGTEQRLSWVKELGELAYKHSSFYAAGFLERYYAPNNQAKQLEFNSLRQVLEVDLLQSMSKADVDNPNNPIF